MSDKNYKSSKLRKRKKKILWLKIWSFIISIILILGGLIYVSTLDSVKILNININDTSFFDKKEIEKIILEEINTTYLNIISRNNIILLPREEIKNKIKSFNQSIESVSVTLSGLRSINVNISEYKPVAVWCNTECYYLNENGFVFKETNSDHDKNLIKFYDWIHDEPIGKNYTDPDTFQKITTLIKFLEKLPLKIISINTDDGLTFAFHSDIGTRILYEINDNPEEVANNLNAVIEKDSINSAQLKNIDYIDLRFGNKVYYKIR